MLDSDASSRKLLIERLFLIRQAVATWFLEWGNATYALELKCQEAQILQEMAA